MSKHTDSFDTICGNCNGVDWLAITDDEVIAQAEYWQGKDGVLNQSEIDDALKGLEEYQIKYIGDRKFMNFYTGTVDEGIQWYYDWKYQDRSPGDVGYQTLKEWFESLVEVEPDGKGYWKEVEV